MFLGNYSRFLVVIASLLSALATSAAQAEILQGAINMLSGDNGFLPPMPDVMAGMAADTTNYPQGAKVAICWDSPCTVSANIDFVQTRAEHGSWNYVVPTGTVGSGALRPHDGADHKIWVKAVSQVNSPANDVFLSGSPWNYKFVNGKVAPRNTAVLEAAPTVGVTPANTAVLVNLRDPYSAGTASGKPVCTLAGGSEIYDNGAAGYYSRKYAIPCSNLVAVSTAVTQNILLASFNAEILPALQKIPPSIQAIAIAWVQPSIVTNTGGASNNSVSYMVATGGVQAQYIKLTFPNAKGGVTCGVQAYTQRASPYFNSPSKSPYTDHHIRPAMMLVGETCTAGCSGSTGTYSESFPAFQAMVDAAFATRGANPAGPLNVDWAFTNDGPRRALVFNSSALSLGNRMFPSRPELNARVLGTSVAPAGLDISDTDILVYVAGAPHPVFSRARVKRGAALIFAATSNAGQLPSGAGQTPLGYYLSTGAAGTYGTVAEPCIGMAKKFPDVAIFVPNYLQGQTMVEALWKSVEFPGTGNFAGDLFAAPFAMGLSKAPKPGY